MLDRLIVDSLEATAMASANTQRPCRRPWLKSARRLSLRLFRCSCLCRDPLQEQEKGINRGPQQLHVDDWGSGEQEPFQITLEDLGTVNSGFILCEEDPLTRRNSAACSAGCVSACHRPQEQKRLKPLASVPLQLQAEAAATSTGGEDAKMGEGGPMVFETGTHSAGSLLTPPVINLIPPTPSDVVDDDQFFDNTSEESGSDGSVTPSDQESSEEKMESVEAEDSKEGSRGAENEPDESPSDNERGAVPTNRDDEGEAEPGFLRGAYQVAPKQRFNAGINLLSFTELDLDDLSNRDLRCTNMAKTEVCLPLHAADMEAFTHQMTRITSSCSLGETLTRSATFHALTQTADQNQEEGSPRQRRITVASYMPQGEDQNGNFPEKDTAKQAAKPLEELNTDEICQWFTRIRLEKCLPFIREAKLCGTDMASVNANTLDVLNITSLEDKEQLLSAIYDELHPPSAITQRLNSLIETFGPNPVGTFSATTASMSKSKSSPHVSCLRMNQRSLKLRNSNKSKLTEITINASERIVHLRTPKETTVGKVMDSCIKMLGVTEDKCLFALKEKQGSSEELLPDQQIGSLLTSTSENAQLELHLCKADKTSPASQNSPGVKNSNENGNINKNLQPAKEERIRELKQQVDSLQNVILQVQELHHSLVAFCSELKSMDGDVNARGLGSAELKRRLELVESRLNDKRQSLQSLRDSINKSDAHVQKQPEVRLLEKMKLNCRVFKEEISIVHLNRQVAQLQSAVQESLAQEKAEKTSLNICSLGQLVSPQRPAMLLVVEENRGPDGHYGFTCCHREGSGLVVVKVDDSQLRVDDRLVEVNGELMLNSTREELTDLLLRGSSAQIVVLRRPPPALHSHQHPLLLQHKVDPGPMQTVCQEREVVTMETPPQRKLMAI